jgi:hypothetical protein
MKESRPRLDESRVGKPSNMDETETRTAVVVTEAGARWPSYSRDVHGRAGSAIVECQPPSEALDEFSTRVIERIRRLQARNSEIPVAIIATSARADDLATEARYRIARVLLSVMSSQGYGELIVSADECLPDEARHELIAFAGALCDGLRGSEVVVRVRFASLSGVRPIVDADPPLGVIAAELEPPARDSYA